MIEFVAGDLLAAEGLDAIAHGCNCAGRMGAGIALPIRHRWPAMYDEYRRRCMSGELDLGGVFAWRCDDGLVVFNLGTQKTHRSGAELAAIETAVSAMLAVAPEMGVARIGMPRIGAGLGGLDWKDVRRLLERLGGETDLQLVVFDRYIPAARR